MTAAHCAFSKDTYKLIDTTNVVIAFCTDCEETNYTIGVSKFILPMDGILPNKLETGLVAVALLEEEIEFSSTIAKICLNSEPIKRFVGKTSMVTGWGFLDSSITPEGSVDEIEAPIIDKEKCRKINTRKRLWRKEFCAGRRDGTGPCIGESCILAIV